MLNLKPLFSDALASIREGGAHLEVAPLAATVYLMQTDVMNQYRYALDHYLTVKLSAPFLQNSSLGSPHQKWAKFTNDDFALLSFHIQNLVRYTARLLSETLSRKHEVERSFAESKDAGSKYIPLLVELTGHATGIGLRVEERNAVKVCRFQTDCTLVTSGVHEEVLAWVSAAEREELLRKLVRSAEIELTALREDHEAYAAECQQFYAARPVIAPFDRLHPSYCV